MSGVVGNLPDRVISTRQRFTIVFLLVLLFAAAAVYKAYSKDVTAGFDELQHVSYTAQIQRDGISTNLESLRLLDPRTFRFTREDARAFVLYLRSIQAP